MVSQFRRGVQIPSQKLRILSHSAPAPSTSVPNSKERKHGEERVREIHALCLWFHFTDVVQSLDFWSPFFSTYSLNFLLLRERWSGLELGVEKRTFLNWLILLNVL